MVCVSLAVLLIVMGHISIDKKILLCKFIYFVNSFFVHWLGMIRCQDEETKLKKQLRSV